jgi:tRNA 2-thiouridine synthesizing protein E
MDFASLKSADGYMVDQSQWSPEFAEWRMRDMGLDPTPERWAVVNWMHAFIENNGITPASGIVIRKGGKELGYDSKSFYDLFPNGPKQAAMCAGGTKPSGC